ncbi:hypothetical protein ABWH96_11055 [Marivirga tractuosa]|uniref:hypothetical protein n=1 Tax=Marivirga tractuosa TaxID=1006 RepID=UPI0035D00D5B
MEVVKVNNSSDITGGCSSSITAQYEIIGTPSATIGFDDGTFGSPNTADNTYELCAESLPINLELTDETSGKTANLTTEWNIEKIAPTSFLVDNVDDGGGGVTPFPYPSNPLVISDTGHYRIELIVLDGSTNCTSTDQLDIYVYDTPEPLFTATGVCEGEDTDFDPSGSNIPTVINGEIIDQWLWDFSYDGTTFNTELTRTNDNVFTRNLGAAGDYDVALITRSDKGCYSDTIVTNVSIYANPDTDLQAFYGQDYEAFLEDDPYAGDPICPGTLIKFFNNSDEFNNDASVIDVDYYLEIDSLGTIITRNIGDSGSFLTPDIFDNQNATNEVYEIRLVAIANPTDGNADNNCLTTSAPIFVDVLPGSGSGFDVFESLSPDVSYNPPYCSPQEFFFRIDNTTNNRLNSNDSVVWTAKNGSTVLGGDTIIYSGGNREDYDFNFNFENDYPNVGPINYTVELQPYAQGVCISSSERTVTVRPKPISNFAPVDTVVTCDSVTYYFEAEQPGLLNYFWTASPVDNDAIADTLRAENNNGAEYWVSFGRPADTDPPLTINVTLLTENPFGCPSDPSGAYTTTIQPEDNFNIDLASAGSVNCLPNTYTFTNNTVPTDIPANTNWELHITNTTLASTTIIAGDTLPVGNQDFSLGYDYNFTQAANYEIRLIALLESTCDLTSDPPISLTFNNSPQMNFRPVQEEGCSPLELDIIDSSFNPDGTDLDVVSISWENLASGAIDDIIVNNEPANYFNSINPIATLLYTTDDGTGFNDYEITLSGENEFGCTNDSTYRVRVFQEPQIDFDITSTNPACEEDYTFDFEFTTSVFPAGTEFTWNWGDGQSLVTDQDTAVSHTFSNRLAFFGQDNYNVTLTAETSNNCIVTVGKTVTLNPRVDASFFKDRIEGCSPLSVNFTSTAIGTGLSGNHVYEKRIKGSGDPWGTIDSVENNGRVSELLENTSGSDIIYEIRYIAESSLGGCSDTSDIQEIIIFPEFSSPAITGTNEVCAFEQSVPYSVPLNPGSTYLWQMPLGAFISNQNADGNEIEVNFSNFSGTLQVQEINSNGCFGTPSTIPINVLSVQVQA